MLPLDVADASSFPAFVEQLQHALTGELGRDTRSTPSSTTPAPRFTRPSPRRTEQQLDDILAVHVKAPFLLTQALLPVLADGSRIINVSSGLTRITMPGSAAYAAAKGAVEVLTRYQAQELGSRGIRVNVVAPGAVATDFSGGMVRDNPQVGEMVRGATALGRLAEADDIGAAVAAAARRRFRLGQRRQNRTHRRPAPLRQRIRRADGEALWPEEPAAVRSAVAERRPGLRPGPAGRCCRRTS